MHVIVAYVRDNYSYFPNGGLKWKISLKNSFPTLIFMFLIILMETFWKLRQISGLSPIKYFVPTLGKETVKNPAGITSFDSQQVKYLCNFWNFDKGSPIVHKIMGNSSHDIPDYVWFLEPLAIVVGVARIFSGGTLFQKMFKNIQ